MVFIFHVFQILDTIFTFRELESIDSQSLRFEVSEVRQDRVIFYRAGVDLDDFISVFPFYFLHYHVRHFDVYGDYTAAYSRKQRVPGSGVEDDSPEVRRLFQYLKQSVGALRGHSLALSYEDELSPSRGRPVEKMSFDLANLLYTDISVLRRNQQKILCQPFSVPGKVKTNQIL